MFATQRSTAAWLVAAAVLAAAATSHAAGPPPARGLARPEIRGILKSVDAAAGTITVAVFEGRQAAEKTFALA